MKSNLIVFLIISQFAFGQNKTTLSINIDKPSAEISPKMWGIFFEDINLGADGGIYAELIKNRSFEFSKPLMGWKVLGEKKMSGIKISDEITVINRPELAQTNPRYLQVKLDNVKKETLGLTNEGFRGMGIKKGLRYDFSTLFRSKNADCKLHINLINHKGENIGGTTIQLKSTGDNWQKIASNFLASETDDKASFAIWFEGNGVLDLDMISLFPSDAIHGIFRADMVKILADLKPGFVRFPGGCIVEGYDLSQRYQWKKTVGKPEDRKTIINRWNSEMAHRLTPDYFQTFGIGFYEYFLLSEDIGAEPVPILNCGMACQFNSAELAPIDDLEPYIQDALDLIEFAYGDVTTTWGKLRAEMGHASPFNLKKLGIGNENWGPQYVERLTIFQKRIKEKYPNIKLIGSVGIAAEGEMFEHLNPQLRNMKMDFVDEHYYNRPEWFLANAKRYDSYSRTDATKVFAGEYAGQSDKVVSDKNENNWLTALSEAAFMTGLERNGDVVKMASYAPLFGHVDGWQWKPNLIWVDNLNVMPTPNYEVQKLFSTHTGNFAVPILDKDNLAFTGQNGLYSSAILDNINKELLIKIVNTQNGTQKTEIKINGLKKLKENAAVTILQNGNLEAINTLENAKNFIPKTLEIIIKNNLVSIDLLPYSVNVLRIKLR